MTKPTFPVLALGPDRYTGDASNERYYGFDDISALTRPTRGEQRAGSRLKWDLIDNQGQSFRIIRETALRTLTPFWLRALMTVFRQREAIVDLTEIEFDHLAAEAFESGKARVWASIARNQEEWSDEEPALEAGRTPLPLADVLHKAKAAVEAAVNVRDLFDRLDEAWPM